MPSTKKVAASNPDCWRRRCIRAILPLSGSASAKQPGLLKRSGWRNWKRELLAVPRLANTHIPDVSVATQDLPLVLGTQNRELDQINNAILFLLVVAVVVSH